MPLNCQLGRLKAFSWRAQLPRTSKPSSSAQQFRPRTLGRRRYTSNHGGQDGGGSSSSSSASSRADRVFSRLPPSMRKYTDRLRNAPVSHVVAFLILHELTAVVPVLGFFGLFHYTDYVPIGYMLEHYGAYVRDGARRFEKYFRKKGWFGFGVEDGPPAMAEENATDNELVLERWESDGKYKVVVEVALAYALTKVLLPVRIIGSVWATPWFAGVLVRLRRLVYRK